MLQSAEQQQTLNPLVSPSVCVCVSVFLLFIVVLAVQQAVPAVTGPGERAQTHGALDAGLVPGALVHAQQEAVGDGTLAARTQLSPSPVLRTWRGAHQCVDRETFRAEDRLFKTNGVMSPNLSNSTQTQRKLWFFPLMAFRKTCSVPRLFFYIVC